MTLRNAEAGGHQRNQSFIRRIVDGGCSQSYAQAVAVYSHDGGFRRARLHVDFYPSGESHYVD